MIVYDVTTPTIADLIDVDGFRDGTGNYMTANTYTGVWVSNWPLDCNDFGGTGDETEVFAIDVAESDIADMGWIEEGKSYREFLVPAELLNRCRRWRPTQDEIEGLTERFGGSRWEVLPGLDPGAWQWVSRPASTGRRSAT